MLIGFSCTHKQVRSQLKQWATVDSIAKREQTKDGTDISCCTLTWNNQTCCKSPNTQTGTSTRNQQQWEGEALHITRSICSAHIHTTRSDLTSHPEGCGCILKVMMGWKLKFKWPGFSFYIRHQPSLISQCLGCRNHCFWFAGYSVKY